MTKPHLLLRSIVMATIVAGLRTASAQEADAKLERFFQQYLDEHFKLQPTQATELGDHRFDGQLDDVSKPARDRWLAEAKSTLAELPKQVDYQSLSRDGQIDYDIFKHHLETEIWLSENLHPFEDDPRTYVNYLNDSVYLILTRSTLPKETNITNCLARMSQIPKVIAASKENLAHPSRVTVDTAIRQNRGMISFYEKEIFELAGETSQRDELKKSAAAVAAQLKDYQTFLERDLVPRATGEWRLGKEKFSRKLDLVLDAGMTADQVHADAQAEFDRVRRDMYVVSRQLWSQYFPKKPLPPDDADGRRATIRMVIDAVGHEHGKPDELASDARETVSRIQSFIRDNDILRLPDPDRCQVIEMPEFKRGNAIAYMDSAAPLDPAAVSFFAISPPASDWMPNGRTLSCRNTTSTCCRCLPFTKPTPATTCNWNTPTGCRRWCARRCNRACTSKAGRFTPNK